MVIEEEDFRLTPVDEASIRFDLELLHTVNKGKSNERKEFKIYGYGLSLEKAIKSVIMYRIEKIFDTTDLKTFLQAYKDESEKIKNLCNL